MCAGGGHFCINVPLLLLTSSLFSFAIIIANYPLFEPLSVLQNLFNCVFCFGGGFSIGYNILLFLFRRLPFESVEYPRKNAFSVFLFTFLSITLIDFCFLFFSAYPGVLTTDSLTTIGQILGKVPYNNTMPYWHTIIVGIFLKLGMALFGNINAAVAVVHVFQILLLAVCFGYVIVTLYQIGVPRFIIVSVYLLYAFMPYNIVYSVTLWKDVPFAGAIVLYITSLYRLLKNVGRSKSLDFLLFVIGSLGFCLLRTNGWYAFLATVVFLSAFLWKQHKEILIILVILLLLCWILLFPILNLLDIPGTNLVEAFAVPMQQIARVVFNGRELTSGENQLLSEIFLMDKLKLVYDPLTVDPVKFEAFRYDKVGFVRENYLEYLQLYVSLGCRYPADYFKAWIDETKGYWNGGYHFWVYTLKSAENEYGIMSMASNNLIARLYSALFRYLEKPAFLQFTVSIGLYVWALFACFMVNIQKQRLEWLLTIPLVVLIIGLWLGSPVYAEFRYAYPVVLSVPFIACVTLYHR